MKLKIGPDSLFVKWRPLTPAMQNGDCEDCGKPLDRYVMYAKVWRSVHNGVPVTSDLCIKCGAEEYKDIETAGTLRARRAERGKSCLYYALAAVLSLLSCFITGYFPGLEIFVAIMCTWAVAFTTAGLILIHGGRKRGKTQVR